MKPDLRIVTGSALALLVALSAPARALHYTMVDLGTLSGDPSAQSVAWSINARGDVAGTSGTLGYGSLQHAFRWSAGVMTDLGTLGGIESQGSGIDAAGRVTGTSNIDNEFQSPHAFVWDPATGTLTDLGSLSGGPHSFGYGIAGGAVVGESEGRGFVWSDGLIDLGYMGGTQSGAHDINDSGWIVGWIQFTATGHRAYIRYLPTDIRDLGTLGGDQSEAMALNGGGVVVGSAQRADGVWHAFLWSGAMHDLGTLSAYSESRAWDVNGDGVVVGEAHVPYGGPGHAFVWTATDGIQDLNALVTVTGDFEMAAAYGINDAGQIVGEARVGGDRHAVLLNPSTAAVASPAPPSLTFEGAVPNPVARATRFAFELPAPAHVRLDVVDASGRSMRQLADAGLPAGRHTVAWDADATLPPGVYWARLAIGERVMARRITVLH